MSVTPDQENWEAEVQNRSPLLIMIHDLRHLTILDHLIYKHPRVGYANCMIAPSRGELFAQLFRMHHLAFQDFYGQVSDDQGDF